MFGLPSSVLVPEQDGAPDYEPTQAANKPAKKEKWCVLTHVPPDVLS